MGIDVTAASQQHKVDNQPLMAEGMLEPCSFWRRNFFDRMPLLTPSTHIDGVFLTRHHHSVEYNIKQV